MPASSQNPVKNDPDGRVWLVAVAAPKEYQAIADALGLDTPVPDAWDTVRTPSGADILLTGVGKANAAGAVAYKLDPSRHIGVISLGIAGALPGSKCEIGDVVCAVTSSFADEGVLTKGKFQSCADLGFAAFESGKDQIEHHETVIRWLEPYSDHTGCIACVSQCSGTDEAAWEIVTRTQAICEAMEGAATSLAAQRVDPNLLTGELRVISNTTGDRDLQRWDIADALEKMVVVLGRIIDASK
jgi:futalosine hydrolase